MGAGAKWKIFFKYWNFKEAPAVTALVLLIVLGAVGGLYWLLFV